MAVDSKSALASHGQPVVDEFKLSQVLVSHVETPEKFYCRLACDESRFNEMYERLIWPLVRSPFAATPDQRRAKAGDNVLAFSSINKRWCRAELMSVHKSEADESALHPTVYLVDFGSVEIIGWNHIQETSEAIVNYNDQQSFCLQCSLLYIKPYNGSEEWSSYAQYLMEKLTKDRVLTMHFSELIDGVFMCDLSCDSGRNGGFVSLIDLLVHSRVARYKLGQHIYHRTFKDEPLDRLVADRRPEDDIEFDEDVEIIEYDSLNTLYY